MIKDLVEEDNKYHEPRLLQLMVSGIAKVTLDESKAIFIGREGRYFDHILNYLRNIETGKPYMLQSLSKRLIAEHLKGLLKILDSS